MREYKKGDIVFFHNTHSGLSFIGYVESTPGVSYVMCRFWLHHYDGRARMGAPEDIDLNDLTRLGNLEDFGISIPELLEKTKDGYSTQ